MPEKLGRYEILEELGRGGFAVVHRAQDTELNRYVALKELHPSFLNDTDWIRRFKREAQTIAQLNHPRIVTIHELFETANRLFIVMRFVDGPSLEHRLEQDGRLRWSQVLDIITMVAEALDYAHDEGILHRDLKPANILLDAKRGPQLSDFGLAKLASEGGSSVTAAGAIVGTPNYIAPEIWEGQGSSKESDIYALGCILCEMLTGEKLFRGDSPPVVMMAHFSPPTWPATWPDDVPPAMTEVLSQALAKQPDERYATVGELIATLTRLREPSSRPTSSVESEQAASISGPRKASWTSLPELPTFLELEQGEQTETGAFVAREPELAQLDDFLQRVLAGRGQLAFVTGEAGQGKTSLLTEFVRRAQVAHPELIVAQGACPVFTGVGDPYLPFRGILGMLSGEIEGEYTAGIISREQAIRLWHLMPHTVEALLEHGPELIDTVVSGGALEARAAGNPPEDAAWLDRLQKVRQLKEGPRDEQGLDQSRIFAEYGAVLEALAAKKPLLLILDDLHWVDSSTVGLLAHLERRLVKSQILLIGTYRPEEVTQARADEAHPLQQVLAEFKRSFGDIWVDLEKAKQTGRAFVDALLDIEPNRLGEDFRQALTRHTGGHPLFTVELLRNLQECGDLQLDSRGDWVAGPSLAWNALPVRVEGIIEQRIGRLETELQEALTVASVEGETFEAELVAGVQGLADRDLVRRLSTVVDKQHRLVTALGRQRVGQQHLSQYRFRHNLFQKYLYNSLDEVLRSQLHQDVGEVLERLYGKHAGEFAMQLAHHFSKADMPDKAVKYLVKAGQRAAQQYANQEALDYYQEALGRVNLDVEYDEILEHRATLLLALYRGREAAEDFERLLGNAGRNGARQQQLKALLGLAMAHYIIALDDTASDFARTSYQYYQDAYNLARELEDKTGMIQALLSTKWFVDFWPELQEKVAANVKEALELSQTVGAAATIIGTRIAMLEFIDPTEWIDETNDLLTHLQGHQDLVRLNQLYFHMIREHYFRGNYERVVEYSDAAVELAEKMGVAPVQYATYKALALLGLGRYGEALEALQNEVADEAHPFGKTFKDFGTGMYYLELMAYEKASELFKHIIVQSERLRRSWLKEWARTRLAETIIQIGNFKEAAVVKLIQDAGTGREAIGYNPSTLSWVRIRGEFELAKGEIDEALILAKKASNMAEHWQRRSDQLSALDLQLRALLRLGRLEEVISLAEVGIQIAEESNALSVLWRIHGIRGQAFERLDHKAAMVHEYEAAAATIQKLADTIGDVKLRQGFMSSPMVSLIFETLKREPKKGAR